MDASVEGTTSRFADRVLRLLERVEYRCARTLAEKDAVYQLRYEAYIRQGLINQRSDRRLYDQAFDNAPNAWITTTFIDGELAATFRIHAAADMRNEVPSIRAYADVIKPHLRMGRTIVDPTRLAANLAFSRIFPELPYLALRPAWLAAEYFSADFVLATIVEQHLPFYRRAFGYQLWCEPREYPEFNLKVACMSLDFRASKERLEARYPFFCSTEIERRTLFGPRVEQRWSLPDPPEGRLDALAHQN
jgi:N-acyl amino acid synthase FeeM